MSEWGETIRIINPPVRGTFIEVLTAKRFEPVKRNKDGWKFVSHRFPIKGGISQLDVMNHYLIESFYSPPLFVNMIRNADPQ